MATQQQNDTQPLPTPSQLREELSGFFTGLTRISRLQDGSFEICLPLMTTGRWRPIIFAKPHSDGTFEVFAYNERGGEFFFPRYELPKMVYLLGIFLQTLSFCKMLEE